MIDSILFERDIDSSSASNSVLSLMFWIAILFILLEVSIKNSYQAIEIKIRNAAMMDRIIPNEGKDLRKESCTC